MELSVIIVNWNTKGLLSECLKSIIRQTTQKDTEIIVVDNASQDGSPEEIQTQFPQVKLIRNETNLGFAKANNIGITSSTGRYICLINSDVVVLPGCFDRMLTYMDKNYPIGILGPYVQNPDGTLQFSCRKFETIGSSLCRALGLDNLFKNFTYFPHDGIRNVDILSGCFLMVRREALGQVGLLDEDFFMYAEDKDWCKRFKNANWGVVYFPEAKIIHYGGMSSSQAPIMFYIQMYRANLQFWRKHYSNLSQRALYYILLLHHMLRIFKGAIQYVIKPFSKSAGQNIERSWFCLRWLLQYNDDLAKPSVLDSSQLK